ncbi:nucleotidyl transferase AbiEii/AbiGii toxin family protein [Acidipropionibacterium timonense]|uniref:nucleotidyl transferase AbiEii/AbiGii toxin family protein n=1 Tax=Acidipropionibacterium timonense TaxID=2161818 RepID=UPI001436B551|nr:nucleotidyl transferase AbiEii/AbiGii toxin family protein [Acidipropionibacterium timonense]
MNRPAYGDGDAIRAALADASARTFDNVEERQFAVHVWVMQRLVARLCAHDQFVLKGGQAMMARLPHQSRLTKDIDATILATSVDAAVEHIRSLIGQPTPIDDCLRFQLRDGWSAVGPTRHLLRAKITPFITDRRGQWRKMPNIGLDVALTPAFEFSPDVLGLRPRLDLTRFDDWPRIPLIPLAEHTAEKTTAMYTLHSGNMSTRRRDLIDLALIATWLHPDPHDVTDALGRVLARPSYSFNTITVPDRLVVPEIEMAAYNASTQVGPWDQTKPLIEAMIGPALAAHHTVTGDTFTIPDDVAALPLDPHRSRLTPEAPTIDGTARTQPPTHVRRRGRGLSGSSGSRV